MSISNFTLSVIPSGRRNGRSYYLGNVDGFEFNQIIIYWDDSVSQWTCSDYPNEDLTIATLVNPDSYEPISNNQNKWEYQDSSLRINLSSLTCLKNICMMYVNTGYTQSIGFNPGILPDPDPGDGGDGGDGGGDGGDGGGGGGTSDQTSQDLSLILSKIKDEKFVFSTYIPKGFYSGKPWYETLFNDGNSKYKIFIVYNSATTMWENVEFFTNEIPSGNIYGVISGATSIAEPKGEWVWISANKSDFTPISSEEQCPRYGCLTNTVYQEYSGTSPKRYLLRSYPMWSIGMFNGRRVYKTYFTDGWQLGLNGSGPSNPEPGYLVRKAYIYWSNTDWVAQDTYPPATPNKIYGRFLNTPTIFPHTIVIPNAQIATPQMTSNNAPTPFVISSSSSDITAQSWAYRSFDRIYSPTNGARFESNSGWLKVDFGSGNATIINAYRVNGRTNFGNTRAPKDWLFQGSNDNNNWSTLHQYQSTNPVTIDSPVFVSPLNNTSSFRWYRLFITDNGGDNSLTEIGEIELYTNASTVWTKYSDDYFISGTTPCICTQTLSPPAP